MLSLTSVLASEVVIGDVADKFKPPCQRVHAMLSRSAVGRIRTDAGLSQIQSREILYKLTRRAEPKIELN